MSAARASTVRMGAPAVTSAAASALPAGMGAPTGAGVSVASGAAVAARAARSSSVSISFEYGKHDALRTHWFSAEMTRKRQYSGIDVHTNMPRAMSP